MSADYEIGELQRQVANAIRIGKVTELDEANARVKVSVAGLTTTWLPWGASRAGETRQWSPPRVGEQVVIASPYGDMAQAVVIASLFSDEKPAPASSKDQETTVYPDGSTVDYNSATNTLTVTVSGAGNVIVNCKVATVVAETSVMLDTPMTHCTGDLVVDGAFSYSGGMTGSGGGITAVITGNVQINGDLGLDGDLSASGNGSFGGSVTDGDGDGGA